MLNDAANRDAREKLRLAVKVFVVVVGFCLILQGGLYVLDAVTAEAQTGHGERTKREKSYYSKFRRPATPPIPQQENRIVLDEVDFRGSIDR